MNDDLSDVMDRVRATYDAVAATTVLTNTDSSERTRVVGLARSPRPRRRQVLVIGIASLTLLIAAGAIALFSGDTSGSTTIIARVPTSATAPIATAESAPFEIAAAPEVDFACGPELPKPLNIPEGYRGPEPLASTEPGQLALGWSLGTSRIEARWPADARLRGSAGLGPSRVAADGKPYLVGSSGSQGTQKVNGTYYRTTVYSFGGVATGCESLQVDLGDSDVARVDALTATMTSGGTKSPFVYPVVPLIVGSEEGPSVPTVAPCSGIGRDVPPNRRGTVEGGAVFPTPGDALEALLESNPTLLQLGYTEIHLPDRSIAYAHKSPHEQGRFLAVVRVAPNGSGWSIDRWEIVGC